MKILLALSLLAATQTLYASSKAQCEARGAPDLIEQFTKEMINSNPYCLQAVKELKTKPYQDEERFKILIENEVSEIITYFDQRSTSSYGVISNSMKTIRKRNTPVSSTAPRNIRKKSFENLKSSCDKLKHCAVSCKLAYTCGFYGSRAIGRAKEIFHDLILRKGTADMDDIRANEIGLALSDTIINENSNLDSVYNQCETKCAKNILRLHTLYYDYKDEVFCKG